MIHMQHPMVHGMLGCCAIYDIHPKLILNSNLVKACLPIIYLSVIQLFWNFAQSTAVILLCSVQIFKMIGQMKLMLWMAEFSQELSLWCVLDGYDRYSILHSNLVKSCTRASATPMLTHGSQQEGSSYEGQPTWVAVQTVDKITVVGAC